MPRTIPDAYLNADGLAVIAAERARIVELNEKRRQERIHAAKFWEGLDIALRTGWPEDDARELAAIHARVAQ